MIDLTTTRTQELICKMKQTVIESRLCSDIAIPRYVL